MIRTIIISKSILLFVGCFSFYFLSAQSGEVNWLKDQHSSNPAGYWKYADKTVYPVAIAAPLAVLTKGFINDDRVLKKKGLHLVTAIAVNAALTQSLKMAVDRQRPYEKYPALIVPYDNSEKGQSFPSGHTSTAFATATSISMDFKKWYVVVPAYTWAASVGYARLKKGEHYPSDVIAGAVLGTGSAFLSKWLNKQLFNKKAPLKNTD